MIRRKNWVVLLTKGKNNEKSVIFHPHLIILKVSIRNRSRSRTCDRRIIIYWETHMSVAPPRGEPWGLEEGAHQGGQNRAILSLYLWPGAWGRDATSCEVGPNVPPPHSKRMTASSSGWVVFWVERSFGHLFSGGLGVMYPCQSCTVWINNSQPSRSGQTGSWGRSPVKTTEIAWCVNGPRRYRSN